MHNTHSKLRSMALAVLWGVSLVAPGTSHTATHDYGLQKEEISPTMSLVCPALYHPLCVVQPVEVRLSPGQSVSQSGAGRLQWSRETVRRELRVPEALIRALLREERTPAGSVELQVPEALSTILATEDWEQMP